jgi:hypothetical protein
MRTSGTTVFVTYPGELRVMDFANPAVPTVLGSLVIPRRFTQFDLAGTRIYAVDENLGVSIIDVSVPATPTLVGSIPLPNANRVAGTIDAAFVGVGLDVQVYDTTNPAAPTLQSTISTNATDLRNDGRTLFVLSSPDELIAYDCTTLSTPVALSTYVASTGIANAMARRGSTIGVIGTDGVELIDATNPAAMVQFSTLPVDPGTAFNDQILIAVDAGVTRLHYSYELGPTSQIRTYDITNRAAPVFSSTLSFDDFELPFGIAASNDRTYIMRTREEGATILAYDFTPLSPPVLIADIPGIIVNPAAIEVSGDFALLASGNRLLTSNIAVPAAPVLAGSLTVAGTKINDLRVLGTQAYMAEADTTLLTPPDGRISKVDITNPAALAGYGSTVGGEFLSVLATPSGIVAAPSPGNVSTYSVTGAAPAFLADVPLFPSNTLEFNGTWGLDGTTLVGIDEGYGPFGLQTADVGDLSNVRIIGQQPSPSAAPLSNIAVRSGAAFVFNAANTLFGYNVRDPSLPVLVSTVTLPVDIEDIHAVDSYLVLSLEDGVLQFLDAADSANINPISSMPLGGAISDIAVRENVLWGSDDNARDTADGVWAVRMPNFPRVKTWPVDRAVCPGQASTTLSAEVANPLGMTYQWQRNGVNIANGGIGGGAGYTGTATATLTITNPSVGVALGDYRCVVSNACGATATSAARVQLGGPPTIVLQPLPQSACVEGSATLKVSAGGLPVPSYQWLIEAPPGSGTYIPLSDGVRPAFSVIGATSPEVTIAAVLGQSLPALLGTRYRCRVANSCGSIDSTAAPLALLASCCDSIDFNGDGLFPDDTDLIDLLTVLAGGVCSTGTCGDIDFNNDGLFPDDTDLLAFLSVLAGGACS